MSQPASTADEILACARRLIVAGGYDGFSYADIAKVVGIRKASIHHHFPAKSDLVRTLISRYRQEAIAGMAELKRRAPGPVEQLRAFTGYWESCIGEPATSFCVCALLACQMPLLPEDVALEVQAYFRDLAKWMASVFEEGAAQQRLRFTGSARAQADLFMATVHGAMLSARATGDCAVFGKITRLALSALIIKG